jgi:purine/pyrimidine-nucleoside phosphorylase
VIARTRLRCNIRRHMSAPKHSSYFDGKVQSLGFERHGRRATVGVIVPGEYHFGTDGAERMTVVSGELSARLDGSTSWFLYPAGTSFEIPQKSGFDVKAAAPAAYLCEFL